MTPDALDGRLFASVAETAAVFEYDERTVRKAIADGTIPAVKVGATARVPVAWIREQARVPEAAGGGAAGAGTPTVTPDAVRFALTTIKAALAQLELLCGDEHPEKELDDDATPLRAV